MESFLPVGGFQLPFQRRLSRLYNDTKKSSDFVKDPVRSEEDPEIKALHRKLRIQKDRLVSWGIEWSDPNQSAEIDESLSKAGLSEVVGSIMSTIKDILAEAEPLWLSSKRIVEGPRSSPDKKPPLVQWDKGRFEDLVRDLTSSIDTLYDLSRTRSGGVPRRMSKTATFKSSVDDFRPFESSRMQTPQQIDPQTLTHLRPMDSTDSANSSRQVVFMSKTAYSELTHGTTREPWAPLLLEYATFDSIYATTGIMPPMARFEKLSAGLQQDPQRAPGTWTGLPRLLGYFEDMENSRLGLVYRFPPSFNAVSFEKLTQNALYSLPTLSGLLAAPDAEPLLEAKFRLAYNLTNTVFDMHARGVTHGNLVDANISFSDSSSPTDGAKKAVDIRRPLVSSFDLFPEDGAPVDFSLWRHPLDPRTTQMSPLNKSTDERVLELYSLAMVLLSVGLWTKLDKLAPELATARLSTKLLDQLAVKCGSLYAKAVEACCMAPDEEASGKVAGEALLSSVQVRVSRYLEACCILDGVSGLEGRLTQELQNTDSEKRQPAEPSTKSPMQYPGDRKVSMPAPSGAPKGMEKPEPADVESDGVSGVPAPKMRLYPHVPLAPDVVEKWNVILMPQINHALRHFYRKHPESVEISLESVGPSPNKTQPTVLVVCTSVGKVRAILKKRIGDLFDGTTGFSLKVCRGQVLRSRKHATSVLRSMARGHDGDDETEAVNPEFQQRPGNGASIGAWIGDRHLPPVSFGGLVLVDDKPYGMTVHHMLDDPDRELATAENVRSSARPGHDWLADMVEESTDDDDGYAFGLSDTESETYSETDITSDYEDDEESEDDFEPGDIPGIEPGCGDGYVVTQPALDDVEDGFYPCAETEDEDHLDTFSLGEVFASSGIRRKQANGLVHEVDWALFEFADGRLPDDNFIPLAIEGKPLSHMSAKEEGNKQLRPTTVAPSASLPGMEVQCMARTSGLQTGQILPALTSVKIYGRTSPSHTYQVTSMPSSAEDEASTVRTRPMGIPGDSGAWVVDRHQSQLCGHVLAWSQRKRVAYICPMDVLLLDVAQTLDASEVRLPGGEAVVALGDPTEAGRTSHKEAAEDDDEDLDDLVEEEEDDESTAPQLVQGTQNVSLRGQGSTSPIRLETSSELRGLSSRLEDMKLGRTQRIGVN
ncbi:het-s domain-containingprotein [Purpureocillium lavendulum]|uniref:Het-s domain-containingprotein n=1 Tax=Purpureocillium lavendulum TaxID=1247861 RepID=A0AB34FXG0_9HYPO|nr:het-s domain-containingprotein [Purpureocillium lavendulum]